MIVVQRFKGKVEGRKVVFSERIQRLHKGKVAHAKGGSSAPANEVIPTGPWAPQIPLINQLFSNAAGLYAGGPPQYYPGQTVLGPNDTITSSANSAINQVNANQGQNQGVINQAATNATNAGANPVATTASAVNPQLQTGISQLLSGGAGALGGVAGQTSPLISQILGSVANQKPTQYNAPQVGAGGLNVNDALQGQLNGGQNPFLSQVAEGALRSSNNNFNRNILPGIGDEASAAGQVGGTRQGIAQGIAAGDQAASSNDIIGRLFAQSFDQQNADRNSAIGTVTNAQGQNAQLGLQTNQLNEAIRAAIMGEGLTASGQAGQLTQSAAQTGQAGQIAGANTAANLLTQGQSLGTDAMIKNASLLPALQGSNLQQAGFANDLGVQQYGFDQAQQDSDVERWFFNQFAPYNALTQFQNYISGPYGSSVAGGANQVTDQTTGQPVPPAQRAVGGNNNPFNRGFNFLTGTPALTTNYSDALTPWKWF